MASKVNAGLFIAAVATGLACTAQAASFTSVVKYDNSINANSSNINKTYGAPTSLGVLSSVETWMQFDAAALNQSITDSLGSGYTINSVTYTFYYTGVNQTSTVGVYFNSNAAWVGNYASSSVLDSSTTPYLTFNNSGQTLNGLTAAYNTFAGSRIEVGTRDFDSNVDSISDKGRSAVTVTLSGQELIDAITSGSNFTLITSLISGPGYVQIMDTNSQTNYLNQGYTNATPGYITVDAVAGTIPEPASVAMIGLGAVGLLARRRR